MLWEAGALIEVRRGGAVRIDCLAPPASVLDDLINPALALHYMARGFGVLHAGGLARRGACAALLGPPGAGKSSLVLAAARRGMEIVSDEIVPFRRRGSSVVVPGGSPFIRVDPAVLGREPRVTASPARPGRHMRNKTTIHAVQQGGAYSGGPWSLRALVFLGPRPGNGRATVCLEPLAQTSALVGLIDQTYNRKILSAGEWRACLSACSTVAARVPAFSLHVPQGLHHLPRAVTLLEALLRQGKLTKRLAQALVPPARPSAL